MAPRSKQEQSARLSGSTSSRSSLADLCPQQIHCAFNICLFPPLFFFCALYYTDVASTLSVLLFLKQFLATNSHRPATFLNACISVLLGIISLSFRQTNIFWVAVLPIALLLVNALHEDVDDSRPANNRTVILDAWKKGIFYDAQMRDATVDGQCSLVSIMLSFLLTISRLSRHLYISCDIGCTMCLPTEQAFEACPSNVAIHHLTCTFRIICRMEW